MKSNIQDNYVATAAHYGGPVPTPCSGLHCTPADRQQTNTHPTSTNVIELLPGFRPESVL
jgi:hypothetical protein